MRLVVPMLLATTLAAVCDAATPRGMDAFRWQRRVILLSAPVADDARLLEQLRILADWRQAAEDRDVTVVRIVGGAVEGVDDRAEGLRERYSLPRNQFGVVLIGKDGTVAIRSGEPLNGADLTRTIDAMPMRRAGQR